MAKYGNIGFSDSDAMSVCERERILAILSDMATEEAEANKVSPEALSVPGVVGTARIG